MCYTVHLKCFLSGSAIDNGSRSSGGAAEAVVDGLAEEEEEG